MIAARDRPVGPLAKRSDVTYQQWNLEEEVELLARTDIGIRPLVDEPWTRGKAHGSVIQYMALGFLVVVTQVIYLSEFVHEGESGYYASSSDEWVVAISSLVENRSKPHQMGGKVVETLEQN